MQSGMRDQSEIVIVGGGHAGAHCAVALRQQGFTGSILLIGREPEYPYERPPLSKDYLAREKSFDRILIRQPQFWEDKQIEFCGGVAVASVDPAARQIALSDGRVIRYATLVWAAGGDPRPLSCEGANLAGIHAVRTRADVDRLMAELDAGARRVVVVGGGYIGLEAAAVLTNLGCSVTLLEALPRVLARVAGEALSRFYEAEHRAHGVDLRTSVSVACIEGAGGKVTGVRLGDGEVVPAQIVIVGIGIVPTVAPLIEAGAAGANGVEVDTQCRTSLPDIYAIGDCAAYANPYAEGTIMRVESVQNANDMATAAARAICGEPPQQVTLPWFWSTQYDLKLQTAGLSIGHDQAVVRGDLATRSFSVAYLRNGRLIAIDSVNAVKDYIQGRKLIEAGATPDPTLLANSAISLKEMDTSGQQSRATA